MYSLYWYDSHILHFLFEVLKKPHSLHQSHNLHIFLSHLKKKHRDAGNTFLLDEQQHANLELTLGII